MYIRFPFESTFPLDSAIRNGSNIKNQEDAE